MGTVTTLSYVYVVAEEECFVAERCVCSTNRYLLEANFKPARSRMTSVLTLCFRLAQVYADPRSPWLPML